MPDSDIVRLALKQKRKILERDAEVMREMARRWLQVEHALEAEMLKSVVELGGAGIVTEAMILRSTRFQRLMYQSRAEFAKYADFMEEKVGGLQATNAQIGIDNAMALLKIGAAEAGIAITFDKLPVSALDAMMGFTADGSPLRNLLMRSYGEATNGMVQALVEGLAKGLNPIKIAQAVADGFGIALDRAMTIARTEQLRAYRMGTLEQYRQSEVVAQYKRMATKDDTTCLGCLFADGEIFDSAEDFSEHPNGRCVIIPVVRGAPEPAWENGKEWFAKQSAERQLSILGQERFDLWKSGTALDEMSKHVNDATWGGSFVPTPLKELEIR